jgi:hypothetical protein
MCKTTTPPRPAAQAGLRNQPPNTTAGAVTPLQSYLAKYAAQFKDKLVPATPPDLPPDVDPDEYKHVPISLWPLRANAVSPYYAGLFDGDTDFSASLLKAAALFAAGQLLAAAKAAPAGAADAPAFKNAVEAEVNANADPRILSKTFPAGSPVGVMPKLKKILTATGPAADFAPTFKTQQAAMIVQSSDPGAAFCIDQLGYGYISAALNEKGFFDSHDGIWLAGDYANVNTYVRIPVKNDHPDAQNTTTRQMCRLFAMIRLKQLPEHDLAVNDLEQSLLAEPKTGPNHTVPWLSPSRGPGVFPIFSFVHDKIGFAGLGTRQFPNVYSEGLIIKWNDTTQVDAFNDKIDPGSANPSTRLSGEIAVCWQNLLADNLSTSFDGIIEVINESVSDFLDQKAL